MSAATTTTNTSTSSTILSASPISCETNTYIFPYEDSATPTSTSSSKKAKPHRPPVGRIGKISKHKPKSKSKRKSKANSSNHEEYYEIQIPLKNCNPYTGESEIWGYQSMFRVRGAVVEDGEVVDDDVTNEQSHATNMLGDACTTVQPREYTFIITTPETFLDSEDARA